MKFLIQFMIIIAFSFLGELLHYFLPLPIPASIYGIVLLFVALELKWVKVKDIRETSSFLIAVMPVMFIPPLWKPPSMPLPVVRTLPSRAK